MKKAGLLFMTFLLSMTMSLMAQKSKDTPKATLAEEMFDFGKVTESSESVSHNFIIRNVGTAPLIIQRVSTTCGCTTPNYTNQPILPGKEGTITVTFSTVGRPGAFNKKITVFTNVPDEVYTLTIKGEVINK